MENSPNPLPYRNGNVVLHSPCHVGKEAFSPADAGNKFCSSCKKVVHNLVGKSDAEIKALFEANGGELCGTIVVRKRREKPNFHFIRPVQKPSYFRNLAATASLMLLSQWSTAANGGTKPAQEWVVPLQAPADAELTRTGDPDVRNNTLITGVIVNQDGEVVPLDFEISIYSKQVLITKIKTENGMFKCDLAGKVSPGDIVGLVIGANTGHVPETLDKSKHGATKRTLPLRNAQNLELVVHYDFPYIEYRIDGGIGYDEPPIGELPPVELMIEPTIIEEPIIIGPVMPKFEIDW